MKKPSNALLFLWFWWTLLVVACTPVGPSRPSATAPSQAASTRPSAATPPPIHSPAPPSPTATSAPLAEALWATEGGPHLRGANIYQRRVFPELDGTTFMGPGPLGPPYTQADFDALAAQGANWVNLSVPGLFTVTPPYGPDEEVVATVDRLIEMAAQAGLYVVLSARTGPGRSEFSILREGAGEWFDPAYLIETVWEDPAARKAWAEMWRFTAQRYRGYPAVVGYDLMVEPNANDLVGVWDPATFQAQYAHTGYDWNHWYPEVVAAIREVDPTTPILVGAMGYSAVEWLPYLQPVDAGSMVYTIHQYEPFPYTHQGPQDRVVYPGVFDADGEGGPTRVDAAWLAARLQPLEEFRQRVGAPVAVNETGLVRWAPNAATFMADQLSLYESLGVNYAVWMWYPAWPPLAQGDHDFNFRLGPEPEGRHDTPNALWETYQAFWGRNRP